MTAEMTLSRALRLIHSEQYHVLDDAGRDADVAAVIAAATTLHVDEVELSDGQKWNVTRILGRNARTVLAEVGEELRMVAHYENEAASGVWDDVLVGPDERAAKHRTAAWRIAREAVRER